MFCTQINCLELVRLAAVHRMKHDWRVQNALQYPWDASRVDARIDWPDSKIKYFGNVIAE